ncbi:MAG TPA: hypothetical protein VGQ21_18885 [Thermoanaerobaculia bacterium]|nr:hypothetical protein [Thermoanaerobaculia bacterium]
MSSIASGGGTDLVVWLNEYHFFDSPVPESYVYIRTYEAGGRPLQPAQIEIDGSYAEGAFSGALAVWNGSDYFVAFGRWYGRYGSFLPGPDVEAVRVTAEGHVIEGSRVSLISEEHPDGGTINALAWDGTHYLASVRGFDTKLLLLDRDGHVVSSQDGLALSIAALPGGGFVMLRVVGGQLELVRFARDGSLSTRATLGPAGQGEAKIDVHGDRIAVVRHTASGVVAEELDNDARVLVSIALPNDATVRSVVWRESAWVAAYDHPAGGCVVRFGSGVDSSTTCSVTARQPIVGVDRAAWVERDVEVRTSSDLSLAGGDLASATVTSQSEAAAIATPSGSLVTWIEEGAIHVGGFRRDGSRRAHRTIDVEAEPHHPVLAAAGAQTLLVYVDGDAFGTGNIRALRLDMDGQPLAPAFTVGHGSLPSVASDGHEWLVVWQSSNNTGAPGQVLAARVTANGDAAGELLVSATSAWKSGTLVAWSGAGYIAAWTEQTGRFTTQLVDHSGAPIANAVPLDDTYSGAPGSLACGPVSCLAAWGNGVLAAVLAPDGTRRSENRQLLPFLYPYVPPPPVVVAPAADGTFRLARDNRFLFLDAAGAPLANITWLSGHADVAGIVDGRIFYTRETAPQELLGRAKRLFAREEPALPRMRAASR